MTDKPDLPKVDIHHLAKFTWSPGDIVIHKGNGAGKKSVPPTKDPQSSSPKAPKGGTT